MFVVLWRGGSEPRPSAGTSIRLFHPYRCLAVAYETNASQTHLAPLVEKRVRRACVGGFCVPKLDGRRVCEPLYLVSGVLLGRVALMGYGLAHSMRLYGGGYDGHTPVLGTPFLHAQGPRVALENDCKMGRILVRASMRQSAHGTEGRSTEERSTEGRQAFERA